MSKSRLPRVIALLLALTVSVIVTASVALRKRRHVEVAAASASVLLDWVRGTPILTWLLVGMACGGFVKLRQATVADAQL